MDLSSKKKMAAVMLKTGISRVRLDPNSTDKIADAITKGAIRGLIKEGVIWSVPAKGVSKGRLRKKRASGRQQRGRGSIEGSSGARMARKSQWISKVRALRRHLRMLKDRGEITGKVFDEIYVKVKNGQVKSIRHLKEIVKNRRAL
jgi:large subunit ribosomal protein L19e